MPLELSDLPSPTTFASIGSVVSWRASSDQLPPPSSVTWTPPDGLVMRFVLGGCLRVDTYSLW